MHCMITNYNARLSQTNRQSDRQTDEHHGNNTAICSTNASLAKNENHALTFPGSKILTAVHHTSVTAHIRYSYSICVQLHLINIKWMLLCFRKIFNACWRESVKPLLFYCNTMPA